MGFGGVGKGRIHRKIAKAQSFLNIKQIKPSILRAGGHTYESARNDTQVYNGEALWKQSSLMYRITAVLFKKEWS